MFGLSFAHILLLAAIALIVIGPKQLPEVARSLGRFLNELKRVTGDVTKTITDARDMTNEELRRQTPQAAAFEPEHSSGHGPEANLSTEEHKAPVQTPTVQTPTEDIPQDSQKVKNE